MEPACAARHRRVAPRVSSLARANQTPYSCLRYARAMTTANKITVVRILMIPAFVTMAIYYGESVKRGQALEWQRFAAIAIFILAAVSDGLDGYVARRYNQRSKLGIILDPIADKGLLLSGIITLSLTNWSEMDADTGKFPVWFPVLDLARRHSSGRNACPVFAQRKSACETALDGQGGDRFTDGGHRMGDAPIACYSPALCCACGRCVHIGFRDHLCCRRGPAVAGRRARTSGQTLNAGRIGE